MKTLLAIKDKYLKEDTLLEREIIYAINSINERKIYSSTAAMEEAAVVPMLKGKNSSVVEWLNEYSEVKNESSSSSSLKAAKLYGLSRASSSVSELSSS